MTSKQLIFIVIILFKVSFTKAQEYPQASEDKINFSAYFDTAGFVTTEDELPFWFYTNTNGIVAPLTNIRFRSGIKTDFNFKNNRSLIIGGGINVRDGVDSNFQIEELFAQYRNNYYEVIAGVKHIDIPYDGLSTVNGNIIWTGNARSIPGIQLKTSKPLKLNNWLTVDASLAHYELNDDRFVDGANIHNKSLFFNFKLSEKSKLTAGLEHYVQWGGFSPTFGQQPDSFKDYIRIFFGKNGGNTRNDQINALGNHLGSYQVEYKLNRDEAIYTLYYQSIFEDRSGIELNNFPDGVWGFVIQPKSSKYINTIVLEYVQTVSQSGRPRATSGGENQQSGGDNYFSNTIYRSGWSYQGNIIGIPFILRNANNTFTVSNRSYAVNAGISGNIDKFNYSVKTTFVRNLGTYNTPFINPENALYTIARSSYATGIGVFSLQLGLDVSNLQNTILGAGIGYQYILN